MSSPFALRRAEFFARLPAGAAAILGGAPEAKRNGDNHYRFRQPADLYFLTGFAEPEAMAVFTPGTPAPYTLFLRPRDPHRETWYGRRAGLEGGKTHFEADRTFIIAEAEARLFELLNGCTEVHLLIGDNPTLDEMVSRVIARLRKNERNGSRAPRRIVDLTQTLHELRLIKDQDALTRMRRAAEITVEAHALAMRACHAGVHEYQLEALIDYIFRRNNGVPGYGSIIGGGRNATILHYVDNSDALRAGEVLLVDAGCEWHGFTADITRSYPIPQPGQPALFTTAQRALYEVVLTAQLQGIAVAVPGSTIENIHDTCSRALTSGLVQLGLLQGDIDELVAAGAHKRYYLHRTSHFLGMDVHDVGSYFPAPDFAPRILRPEMVLTVEPGLYISDSDTSVPPEYRGIGIRIEDDIRITAEGHEVLTAALPKEAVAVEKLVGTGATLTL